MILSDIDIRKAQGDGLVIEPFDERHVTALGYDVTVGGFVYAAGFGLLKPSNGMYNIPSEATVQILTKETLWISENLAGTIHSRALLASRGFSHISTTIDPSWIGPLLITMTNLSKADIKLDEGGTFATVMFHLLKTPTSTNLRRFSFVRRLLTEQILEAGSSDYVQRVSRIVGDQSIVEEFGDRLAEANKPLRARIGKTWAGISWIRIFWP
jgi:deoxycytidine triphosphate deaminase